MPVVLAIALPMLLWVSVKVLIWAVDWMGTLWINDFLSCSLILVLVCFEYEKDVCMGWVLLDPLSPFSSSEFLEAFTVLL